jgi:hypothetical protein
MSPSPERLESELGIIDPTGDPRPGDNSLMVPAVARGRRHPNLIGWE